MTFANALDGATPATDTAGLNPAPGATWLTPSDT